MNSIKVAFVSALGLSIALYFIWGPRALFGFSLGTAASSFNLVALWLGIRVFAKAESEGNAGSRQAAVIVLLCFLKMPVFIVAGFLTWKEGSPSPGCFLIGLALVYLSMIWWTFEVR